MGFKPNLSLDFREELKRANKSDELTAIWSPLVLQRTADYMSLCHIPLDSFLFIYLPGTEESHMKQSAEEVADELCNLSVSCWPK